MTPFIRTIALILVILSGAVAWYATREQTEPPVPNARPQEPTVRPPAEIVVYDFGVVSPGDRHRHTFVLQHTGARPVTVHSVQTTCSCVVPRVSHSRIEPGESWEVEVEYHPAAETGNDERSIRILFAEDDAASLRLVVRAAVRNALTLTPEQIHVSTDGGSTHERQFTVENFSSADFTSVECRPQVNWLSTTSPVLSMVGQAPRGRQIFSVGIKVDASQLPPGTHTGQIIVTGQGSQPAERVLTCVVEVPSRVTLLPAQVFAGGVKVGETFRSRVLVRLSGAKHEGSPDQFRIDFASAPDIQGVLTPMTQHLLALDLTYTPTHPGKFSPMIRIIHVPSGESYTLTLTASVSP